jgi:hypothetical protein
VPDARAWPLADAARHYGTSFEADVAKLGNRPCCQPLDRPSLQ